MRHLLTALVKIGILLISGILFCCTTTPKQEVSVTQDSGTKLVSAIHMASVLLQVNEALSQQKRIEIIAQDDSCYYIPHYSTKQRRQFYPFNRANRIEVISFTGYQEHEVLPDEPAIIDYVPATTDLENDSVKMVVIRPEKKAESRPFQSPTKDSLVLTQRQIDQLTNLLYNYDFGKQPNLINAHLCYDPHHKIVFYNANNQPFAFIEICFECQRLETSEKIQLKAFCKDKWKLLEDFFHTLGIRYGLPSYEQK